MLEILINNFNSVSNIKMFTSCIYIASLDTFQFEIYLN